MNAIYLSIDDPLRRIANQAFFDELIVLNDNTIHGEPGIPFNVFLNPTARPSPSTSRDGGELGTQTGDVAGLDIDSGGA